MISITMADMVGTPTISEPKRDAMRKAIRNYKRYIDNLWYHPKNLYETAKTPAGRRVIKFGIGLL